MKQVHNYGTELIKKRIIDVFFLPYTINIISSNISIDMSKLLQMEKIRKQNS